MGFVSLTGQSKAFTGAPFTIPDTNSIQAAVAGTLDNPSAATKNMISLAVASRLDMFNPKRTGPPNNTAAFRGYPHLTFNYGLISKSVYQSSSSTGYSGNISFTLNSNGRFVGFPYRLFIQVFSGNSFTPPEPDNPAGANIQNYFETTVNVSSGSIFNQTFNVSLNDVNFSNLSNSATFQINIYYTQAVNGSTYLSSPFSFYNGQFEAVKVTVADISEEVSPQVVQNPYPFAYNVAQIAEYSCSAQQVAAPIVIYSNSSSLVQNVNVSLSTATMQTFTGSYDYIGPDNNRYVLSIRTNVSTGLSFVFGITQCTTGGNGPQQ